MVKREADRLAGLTEQLLDSAPDAVVIVGPDGRILFVNTQAENLFGYEREELVGQLVEVLVPERATEIHPRHRANYYAHPITRPMGAGMDLSARKKDGTEIPVDIALSSLQTKDGILVSAAVRDVTERIRAAQEKEQLEAQLRQSRLESIGQLAGGVAHDFNNILAGIMTYSKLVEEELQNADVESFRDAKKGVLADITQIIRATERAAALTRQLLLFSRKDIMRTEVVDLATVIGDMEDLLRHTIGEHIHLRIKLVEPLMPVNMDPGHIEQILMNLVVNARDAMPEGGQLVVEAFMSRLDEAYAELREGVAPGEYVCLSVSDTGAGMEKATVGRAFEPFFTTKQRGEGSGLGLATVYGIATRAHGHVAIYSEVGLGTTVKVYLPPVKAGLTSSKPKAEKFLDSTAGETVLLVEDEELVRQPAAMMLERHGYQVLVAAGPNEALELLDRFGGPVDVLLTDVIMPGMTGKELSEKVTASRPETRVIFMSGYSQDVIVHQGSVAPGVVLVEKPFTTELLLGKLRKLLDRA